MNEENPVHEVITMNITNLYGSGKNNFNRQVKNNIKTATEATNSIAKIEDSTP